ncbi:MAG TPA: SRPBCC family protein [Gemmatimonadales bacterium]|nr:SRPBCC family protein [Gemmatimonadales bacterium]
MKTVDRITIRAPIGRVFDLATNVERWPRILAHYRSVRFLHRPNGGSGEGEHGSTDTVEMAAWRPFGPIRYPAWWVSEMTVDPGAHEIRYRHVRGITRGMDVCWRLVAHPHGVDVTIEHEWAGPAWPVVGPLVARLVIGPVFIHGIAKRTLAGIKKVIEGEAQG